MIEELEFAVVLKTLSCRSREAASLSSWMASKLIGIWWRQARDQARYKYPNHLEQFQIKRITKTLQTPLVETAQTVSRTRHEARSADK